MRMKRMVLFHKTPAIWSKLDYVEEAFQTDLSPIEDGTLEEDSEIFSLFYSDIYIRLCESICHNLGIEELHIVQGFSEGERRNWINGEKKGRYQIDDLSTYWCVDSPKELLSFLDADVLFSRGNYQTFHHYLHQHRSENANPTWIHYPATALMFPHLFSYEQKFLTFAENPDGKRNFHKQITGMNVEHQLPNVEESDDSDYDKMLANLTSYAHNRRETKNVGPYDFVLVDDETSIKLYEGIYQNSIILKFTKPANLVPLDFKYERKYDLIFCGTTLQATKNHMQFITLLKRLDHELGKQLRVAIAGNRGDIPAFSQGLTKQYEHIIIDDFGELSRTELHELFNDTKAIVILSGRDCNPRIIQEAGLCGTFVIVADTMSDGLEILKNNPLLGSVIPTKKASWFYQRNGNLLFEVNRNFAIRVLSAVDTANSPFLVRKISHQKYSMRKASEFISDQIKTLR